MSPFLMSETLLFLASHYKDKQYQEILTNLLHPFFSDSEFPQNISPILYFILTGKNSLGDELISKRARKSFILILVLAIFLPKKINTAIEHIYLFLAIKSSALKLSWIDKVILFGLLMRGVNSILDYLSIVKHKRAMMAMLNAEFETSEEVKQEFSNIQCHICYCSALDPVSIPCGHIFCSNCIHAVSNYEKSSENTSQCPICRTRISSKSEIWPLKHYRDANGESEIPKWAKIKVYS
jgi:Zinc finger, C3HC4 type (RING finger)